MERVISNEMELPQVVICAQRGYKKDAFTTMGATEYIFRDSNQYPGSAHDFDLDSLWERGTYSRDELKLAWLYLLGKTGKFIRLSNMLLLC